MNSTLMWNVIRQRSQSPARMALSFFLFTLPLSIVAATKGGIGIQPLVSGQGFAFLLAAGVIGAEASSGVFQLLFARPVTRAEYVLSRWAAVALMAAALAALQVGFGGVIVRAAGIPLPWKDVSIQALEQALAAIGTVSVLTLFSSVLPAFGDLVAVVLGQIFAGLLSGAGQVMQKPWLARGGEELGGFFNPQFHWMVAFGPHPSWFHVVSWPSTVTLCLVLAIVALNRREISYATD